MMKRVSLFIIFIIIISQAGCIIDSPEKNYTEYHIKIEGEGSYYLIIPVLIDPETNTSLDVIYQNLIVNDGLANFKLEYSCFGLGLNISGENDVELLSYIEDTDFLYFPFSMQNCSQNENFKKNGRIDFWIYLNGTNQSNIFLNIEYTSTHSSGGYIVNISGKLKNGWNIIEGNSSAGGG